LLLLYFAQRKEEVDVTNLHLQSLLYEQGHVRQEIDLCKDFQ